MKKRIEELDFLKGICILLMIVFHLVYIGDKYPYAKQLVYTFHMPVFLVISGYLMRVEKSSRQFLGTMLWIFVPYVVMESGYVVMSAVLPVREKVEELGVGLWLEKLFLHPLGPYWYLHTLIVCGLTYWAVEHGLHKLSLVSRMMVLALCYAFESEVCQLIALSSGMYFWAGAVLSRSAVSFTSLFRPSGWAVWPLAWLACYPANLNRFTLGGMAIVYLSVSLLLAVYRWLPARLRWRINYIGGHTFILLVFSPVFTMLVKPLVPVFAFDPSGMCFLAVALAIAVAGSFLLAMTMDRLGVSRFFWGKKNMVFPASFWRQER